MIGINNVTIIGNIGTVSEIIKTSNGSRFINMTIATTEQYYSASNEKKNNTVWHNVIIWNSMTELQKMLSKGDLIYIEGRLNYRKKGENNFFTEIVAKNIRILNKKNYSLNENFTISSEDFNSLENFDENE
jgi:single stranded DNA-binding protein